MLATMTNNRQLILPQPVLQQFPEATEFNVAMDNHRLILTPVQRQSPGDVVREKLAALGITEEDVADAIAWARKQDK